MAGLGDREVLPHAPLAVLVTQIARGVVRVVTKPIHGARLALYLYEARAHGVALGQLPDVAAHHPQGDLRGGTVVVAVPQLILARFPAHNDVTKQDVAVRIHAGQHGPRKGDAPCTALRPDWLHQHLRPVEGSRFSPQLLS